MDQVLLMPNTIAAITVTIGRKEDKTLYADLLFEKDQEVLLEEELLISLVRLYARSFGDQIRSTVEHWERTVGSEVRQDRERSRIEGMIICD